MVPPVAVTVSLVPEAAGGPFVLWDDFHAACQTAARLGFDGVELFAPAPEVMAQSTIREALTANGLRMAAVGTGAGWVVQRLTLTHADAGIRQRAEAFIGEMIRAGAEFGAPAIIGSMQGRWEGAVDRASALGYLADALHRLGELAHTHQTQLIYEPLNRYETNLHHRQVAAADWLDRIGASHVVLLADLFHMNIEESDVAAALQSAARRIGHVHWADSNRQAVGCGHTDAAPIAKVLKEMGYSGWVSAECLPLPDSLAAATQTLVSYRAAFC